MNMKNLNIIFAFLYLASLVLSSPIDLSDIEDVALPGDVTTEADAYVVSSVEDCETDDEVVNAGDVVEDEYEVSNAEDCESGDEVVVEKPVDAPAADKPATDKAPAAEDEYEVSNAEDCESGDEVVVEKPVDAPAADKPVTDKAPAAEDEYEVSNAEDCEEGDEVVEVDEESSNEEADALNDAEDSE